MPRNEGFRGAPIREAGESQADVGGDGFVRPGRQGHSAFLTLTELREGSGSVRWPSEGQVIVDPVPVSELRCGDSSRAGFGRDREIRRDPCVLLRPDARECLANLVRQLGAVMSNHDSGTGHDTISSDDAQSLGRGPVEEQCRMLFFDEGNAKFRGLPQRWFSGPINGPHPFDFISRNIYDVDTRNHDSQGGLDPGDWTRGV